MPQRRNYYGGYYDQSSENYDPYSKWGNVGLTIRNTINRIVAKRKEQQELAKKEAQEKWAMAQEEQKLDIERRKAEAYIKGQEPTAIGISPLPGIIQEADALVDSGLAKNRGDGIQKVYNLRQRQAKAAAKAASQTQQQPTMGTGPRILAPANEIAPEPPVMPAPSPHQTLAAELSRPPKAGIQAIMSGDYVELGGKKYKIDKDGIVTIGGQKFRIQ